MVLFNSLIPLIWLANSFFCTVWRETSYTLGSAISNSELMKWRLMSLCAALQNGTLRLHGPLKTEFGTLVRSCFAFFLSYREHFWNNGIFDDIFYHVFSLSFIYVGECHFSLVIYVSRCLIFTLNVSEKIYTYITYVHIILLYLDVYYIQ